MSVFATTRWSLIARAGHGDTELRGQALEALCRSYWMPAYVFVRGNGLDEESAKDVTQAFFAKILERNTLTLADPERGRFRTFLLTLLKRFLADWRDFGNAQKRGGGVVHVSMDAGEDSPALTSPGESPEEAFDRRWAMTLMERVVETLREEARVSGREALFSALAPWLSADPDPGTYVAIGEASGMSRGAVSMAMHRLRARFGDELRREVADTLADAGDLEAEMEALRAALRK